MKIVQISDIHFGAATPRALSDLKNSLFSHDYDILICSGDITQNGYEDEFRHAAEYFKDFNCPKVFVAGNHDMPQWEILKRFINQFTLYKKYISNNLESVSVFGNVVIVAINSARIIVPHTNWANGGFSKKQCEFLIKTRKQYPDHKIICVLHHPLNHIPTAPIAYKTFGAANALKAIKEAKIDLVMNGHLHMPNIKKIDKTLFVTASTAASFRARGYSNGYMIYDIDEHEIKVTQIDL